MAFHGEPRYAVLHLCGDFAKQQIYTLLVKNLAQQSVAQVVYAPVRTAAEAAWSAPELVGTPCHLRHILSGRDRLFFRAKVRRVVRDIPGQVDLATVRLVHAHFLYSDGAIALALKKQFGLPFIVAVRNTDINAFMRYRPDLASTRDRVLAEAEKVVFLSHAYQSLLSRRLDRVLRQRVEAKSLVVPNGIQEDWLAEAPPVTERDPQSLRLLYVGDFSLNKNIPALLDAVGLLAKSRDARLTLVGGGGDGSKQVDRLLRSGRFPFAKIAGRVSDPRELRGIYREHDVFVMVSHFETFGVVYIEALSQGLPIVHSRGQGVDGYFEPATVAEAAHPQEVADIAACIDAVAARLPGIRGRCIEEARRFDWRHIATTYSVIYNDAAPVVEISN